MPYQTKKYQPFLAQFQTSVEHAIGRLQAADTIKRIWQRDRTVWPEDAAEIAERLGWLDAPRAMVAAVAEINGFVQALSAQGITRVLLLGMGGSSLAPEVLRLTFGVRAGYFDLAVLDSTHPTTIKKLAARFDAPQTLFIVSTKSGGTVETLSLLKYFYNQALNLLGKQAAGRHFIAITDPGSGLETLAKELGFLKIFRNDPHIGGRYSALSYFGLVPAALIGMDLEQILRRAAQMAASTTASLETDNTSAWLGATMAALAAAGRDKLTLILSPSLANFGPWVEQLIAESTGKEGKGILPVIGEPTLAQAAGDDRFFVYLRLSNEAVHDPDVETLKATGHPLVVLDLDDPYDLCAEFFRWEMATAVAASLLQINPFDQPNVESAKILTREMVAAFQRQGKLPHEAPVLQTDDITVYANLTLNSLEGAIQKFILNPYSESDPSKPRPYVAFQIFCDPAPAIEDTVQALRKKIQHRYNLATTVGYGPRFLHSTGQLHKGDAGQGLFIQITSEPDEDLPIADAPGSSATSISFGTLIQAQALGDRQALLNAKRKVICFHLGPDLSRAIKSLRHLL